MQNVRCFEYKIYVCFTNTHENRCDNFLKDSIGPCLPEELIPSKLQVNDNVQFYTAIIL